MARTTTGGGDSDNGENDDEPTAPLEEAIDFDFNDNGDGKGKGDEREHHRHDDLSPSDDATAMMATTLVAAGSSPGLVLQSPLSPLNLTAGRRTAGRSTTRYLRCRRCRRL